MQEFKSSYEKYITSSIWEARRKKHLKKHAHCRACKRKDELHVHHLTYVRMGSELSSDLMTLCNRCHNYVHTYHKNNYWLSLHKATYNALDKILNSHIVPAKSAPVPQEFVPARQRLTEEQRKNAPHSGREGRLGGVPIVRL